LKAIGGLFVLEKLFWYLSINSYIDVGILAGGSNGLLISNVDTELLEIATYGNRTELNFKTRYRSSYEDVTTDIVNFCTDHFMVERVLSNNRVRISSQARKPLIENSSKKDKLLKLKLVHY
jgi:hypothetical protein|tara:strand:+ start:96 stop:458 length:363 start_codon:yes stop_codon:yes gene_type:complete